VWRLVEGAVDINCLVLRMVLGEFVSLHHGHLRKKVGWLEGIAVIVEQDEGVERGSDGCVVVVVVVVVAAAAAAAAAGRGEIAVGTNSPRFVRLGGHDGVDLVMTGWNCG
jgi:hypothetical protein